MMYNAHLREYDHENTGTYAIKNFTILFLYL